MPEEVPLIAGQVTTEWSEWNECPAGYAVCGIRYESNNFENIKLSQISTKKNLYANISNNGFIICAVLTWTPLG